MGREHYLGRENLMKSVRTSTLFEDPDFQVSKEFSQKIKSLVTYGPTGDHFAYSTPSGGRVVYYKLPKPIHHRGTGKILRYIDVKGVGLTIDGNLNSEDLRVKTGYQEIARCAGIDYPYGPLVAEGLTDAMSIVEDALEAIRFGLDVPPILAIYRLHELIMDGEKVDPREILVDQFGYRPRDFAILQVRGFQSMPIRSTDLVYNKIPTDKMHLSEGVESNVAALQLGRRRWKSFVDNNSERIPSSKVLFQRLQQHLVNQAVTMIRTGLAPEGFNDTQGDYCCHVHLQNVLVPTGAYAEWTPLAYQHTNKDQDYYIVNLINHLYTNYLCLSFLFLDDQNLHHILSPGEFFAQVILKLPRHFALTDDILDTFKEQRNPFLYFVPAHELFYYLCKS